MKSTLAALAAAFAFLLLAQPAAAADAAAGEQVFRRLCTACHIATAEGRRGVGPTLFGVVGRKSGSVDGFRYSTANQNANLVWTPEVLDKYLTNPREVVPGTIMAFAGIRNDADRANVIAYLQTLK
ncbi:MAG: c-type cytochrome [Tagaea sp.]|nr:cytochrome c family protein [Magnetospirillum sp.]